MATLIATAEEASFNAGDNLKGGTGSLVGHFTFSTNSKNSSSTSTTILCSLND